MEFVEGRPLTKYAAEHNLPVRARLELFLKVCDAVEHAHRKGVIHRDLKPGNILVDATGHPRILDFGVAKGDGCGCAGDDAAYGHREGDRDPAVYEPRAGER